MPEHLPVWNLIQGLVSLLFSALALFAGLAFKSLQRENAMEAARTRQDFQSLNLVVTELSRNVNTMANVLSALGATAKAHDESDRAQFRRLEVTQHEHDQRLRQLESGKRGG